jgi:hypothetical protein
MSGLINSAGSRSGIIGTTELEYEEGVGDIGFSIGTADTGKWKWIRVGQLVTVFGQIDGGSESTSTAGISLTGLPFTAVGPHNTGHAGHGAVSYPDGMGSTVISAVAATDNTTVFFGNIDSSSATYSQCSSSWNVRFAISYRCYP